MKRRLLTRFGQLTALSVLCLSAVVGPSTQAANYTWDKAVGNSTITEGGGTWAAGSGNWFNGVSYDQSWADGNGAIFGGGTAGTAGIVTLGGPITATNLIFNTPFAGNYTIDTAISVLTLNSPANIAGNESATIQSGAGGSLALGATAGVGVAAGKTLTISSPINGSATVGLTKTGNGTLELDGALTFGNNANGLTISSGGITIGGAGALLGSAGKGCVVTNNGALIFNSSANSLVYGACSGTGSWEQKGSGMFTFSGGAAYNFTGNVILSGGILRAAINSATAATRPSNLGAGASQLFLNGGELQCATGNNTANNTDVNYGRNTTVGGSGVTITSDRGTAISSQGNAVTYTFGTLSISNQTLTVQAGASGLNGGTAGIAFGDVSLTGAPTFLVNSNVANVSTLLTLGAISNDVNLVTFAGTGNSRANGIIGGGAGTGGLTKNGNGTLTLAGANTYTGNTIISAGTLALTGSGSIASPVITVNGALDVSALSSFTLNSGQDLAGTGAVVGNVLLAAGSTVHPGSAGTAGTLTFGNNLTFGNGATAVFDCSANPASGNDKMVLANTSATLNGGGATLTINQLGGVNTLAAADYLLFDLTGASGSVAGGFNPTPAWTPSAPTNAANYSVITAGRQVFLKYAAPSTNRLTIETAADGSGSLFGDTNVPAGSSVTGYAIVRTPAGAFVTNVPGSWSLVGATGGVMSSNLVVAADNKSATFIGYRIGSAKMQTVAPGYSITNSGTLTVGPGVANQLQVETAADGNGAIVPSQLIAFGSAVTGYAIARDEAGNFVGNVAANWSLINLTGQVVSTNLVVAADLKSASFGGSLAGSARMQAAAAGLTAGQSGTLTVTPVTKPNIIYILADDLGIDGLSCYGGDAFQTPSIDSLAASGIRFQTCFAIPLCGPSRCTLMTGRYPFRTGGLDNQSWNPGGPGAKAASERPIAALMRQAGYATGMAGKWRQIGETPSDWGFDEYITDDTGSGYFWQKTNLLNGVWITQPAGTYQPDVIQNFTVDFIQRHKDHPFFFYYSMHLVHTPIQHTPDSPPGDGGVRYTNNIAYMDKQVGALVATLESLGLRENTLIIFTGDNGSNPMYTTTVNGRTLSGYKGSMLEGGARVPFIASWPGTTPSNTVSADIVSSVDPHATFLELAGTNQPTDFTFDSVSFLPQLLGQTGTPREWAYVQLGAEWYVREPWFKLDQAGNLRDMSDAPFTEPIIAPAADTSASLAARARLTAVLSSLNPSGTTVDTDGDGTPDADEISLGRNLISAADLGFEFNDPDGSFDGWGGFANMTGQLVANGTLHGTTTTQDPNITRSGFLFNSAQVPQIVVKLKAGATGLVQLYWAYTGTNGFAETRHLDVNYGPESNVWQTVVFPLSANPEWSGKTITDLRIDPIMATNTTFEIDWIRALNGTMTAPTISAISNQTVAANTATSPLPFTIGSGWTPASSLEITGYSSNTNLLPDGSFAFGGSNSNRTVTLTPAAGQAGTATVQIVVSDGVLSATNTFVFTVNSNTAPTLTAITDRALIAGQTLTFTNVATDNDVPAQTLSFALLNPPTGATIATDSGVFSWRPTLAQAPSTNPLNVVVTDNGLPSLSATQNFLVTVLPPVKPAISAAGVSNGQFSFSVAGDSGPDYLILTSTNLTNWSPVWTNGAAMPPFRFTDPNNNGYLQRFYRVLLGP